MGFLPYDPMAETLVHRQHLPHWRQEGKTYFVTTRLADSVPRQLVDKWKQKREAWLQAHGIASTAQLSQLAESSRHEYHREFTLKFHHLLDAGYGQCVLARADCSMPLLTRLMTGHLDAYQLDAWCLMPNHIHAIVQPLEHLPLGEIIRRWKGGSARDINQVLQRSGPLWQREPFDHIIRSEAQLQHFRKYIADNPTNAGLQHGFVLGFGSKSHLTPAELKPME